MKTCAHRAIPTFCGWATWQALPKGKNCPPQTVKWQVAVVEIILSPDRRQRSTAGNDGYYIMPADHARGRAMLVNSEFTTTNCAQASLA